MAFCPNCGNQVSDDARFCPSCGATVTPSAPQAPGGPAAPSAPAGATPVPPQAQPPAGAPPAHVPGVVPPPPGGRKKGSGWKIALVIILVVLLLIGAAVAGLAFFVFKTVKAPVDVTNRYIEAINNDKAEEAWPLLASDSRFRRDYTLSTFEREVVKPYVHSLKDWNAHEVSVSGSQAKVDVDIKFVDDTEYEFTFELKKEDGDWKIYNYSY